MPKILKNLSQYFLIVAITGLLIWLSLRGLKVHEGQNKFDFILTAWEEAGKTQLMLMALVAFLSHYVRAVRWKMLLLPTENKIKTGSALISILIGYLVNLGVPRGGEVSRCYNLFKLEKTPISVSFGTVIIERIVDVICLFLVVVLAFIFEWGKLLEFIDSLDISSNKLHLPLWVIYSIGGIIILIFVAFLFRKNQKLLSFINGFKAGFSSLFRLKNKWLFIFYSILIWALYYLMTYFTVQAFQSTADLNFSAVLSVFALGSIAMAMPLPGGAGSYHTIVPLGLFMLYKLPMEEAIAFVFVFHAWQTLVMIIMGVISLLITYRLVKRNKSETI